MARREDYLTPEVLADVDEVDRYLASKGKIDYPTHTEQDSPPTAYSCLLYTSPSPRDGLLSRMPSSA